MTNSNISTNDDNVFSYIEDYSSLVVCGDYSDAIQAALDTGMPVIGEAGKLYTVTKILNSNGRGFHGEVKLELCRTTIPNASITFEHTQPNSDTFRAIYVQSAYDLCEMMRIKSMGFNTVIHYCYFNNNGVTDSDGTIIKLINNCSAAGLNVVVNTHNSIEHNNCTVAQVIAMSDSYSNVIGYSVIDEPGSSGVSVASQESLISTLRALTNKKLYCVDFAWRLNTWSKPWSYNYDVFLVDSYSMYYATGGLSARINNDLGKMRTDFAACLKMTGKAKVIPCFQAYAQPVSSPLEGISGTYAFDIEQIAGASRVFGKVGNGDYACFIWDGGFTSNVSNSSALQSLVADVFNHAGKGEVYDTRPILFGGVASNFQRGVTEIYNISKSKDPNNNVDPWLGGGAWPVRLTSGSAETPIHTVTTGIDIAGIGFKDSFSRLVTSHNALLYVTAFGVFENYGPTLTGTSTLNIYTTPDGGYSEALVYSGQLSAGTPFRLSSKTTNSYDGVGGNLVIGLGLSTSNDYLSTYRRFIYGLIASTNW